MLSIINSFGPSTAILVMGYAAELGNNYYKKAEADLLHCRERQAAALKKTAATLKSLKEPREEEIRVKYVDENGEGETVLSREQREGINSFLYMLTLQEKRSIQGMCDGEQKEADAFGARYIAPYLPLVSDAAPPLAGLVFAVNGIATAVYRALYP